MSNESENEDIDIEWRHSSDYNKTTPSLYADVNVNMLYSLLLKPWEIKMIIAALSDRLEEESDLLVAKHLGLTIRRRMAQDKRQMGERAEKMIEECDKDLRDLHNSSEMDELKLKEWTQYQIKKTSE